MNLKKHRPLYIGITLAISLCVAALIALNMGAMKISSTDTLSILWGRATGNQALLDGLKASNIAVLWDIRLPRIICAVFVGMGLSISGVIFQSLLCNPLADPYTLGVSTGAAFGASLAIYLGISYGIILKASAFAFIFAFLTLLTVIAIARKGGGFLSSSLIISGIIVSAILSSGISFIKMLAGENVSAIVFWLMGSLSARSWGDAALVVPVVIIGGGLAYYFANDLNVMTLGDETASSLGVDVKRTRLIYLTLGAAITASCVAVSGIIGFIGLVVPHILRFWLTGNNRTLIPLSALLGGLILLLADSATRIISSGEIPVGVITTLIGGPFFIYVFLKNPKGRGIDG